MAEAREHDRNCSADVVAVHVDGYNLAEAREPNTIVQLERKWPGDEREWRRRWQPAETSPLIVKYLDEIRAR